LAIFDNVATLFRTAEDPNSASTWLAAQDYILGLRRRGIAVLLIDHDNKTGGNRGTSAKHDVLDTVIQLKQPSDYVSSQGARFEVCFTKHRGFRGKDAMSFEAQLAEERGQPVWTMRDAEEAELARFEELTGRGLKDRDVRKEMGIGGSKIARLKTALANRGKK
jgi:putative DNA primase/helicase